MERGEILEKLGCENLERLYPDRSVYDFMPFAAGINPTGSSSDPSSLRYIIYNAIQLAGEPADFLLGTADYDECLYIKRFADEAGKLGFRQGNYFNFDEEFAAEYIHSWRWEIVRAICREAENTRASNNDKSDQGSSE